MLTTGKKIETFVLLGLLFVVLLFFWKCPLQELFGIPCPGCNMTTALYYLLMGNLKSALFYHPLVLGMLFCIILELLLYVKYRNFTNRYAKMIFWGFIILLIIVYIYRMIVVFPSIPMVYVEDNVFAKMRTLFW